MSDFLPQMQRSWGLEEFSVPKPGRLRLQLVDTMSSPRPSPLGRMVSDVLSWPSVALVRAIAVVHFSGVEVVSLVEERFSQPDASDDFEGSVFRRYRSSRLLQKNDAVAGPSPRYHYAIVFQDDVLDVLCAEPPEIVLDLRPATP